MKYIISYIIILQFSNLNLYSQENKCNGTLEPTLFINKIDNVPVPFQNNIALTSFEKQNSNTRKIINLKGVWKEYRFAADHDMSLKKRDNETIEYLENKPIAEIVTPEFNDIGWTDKEIPSVTEKMNGDFPPEYYSQGGVWFRKHFSLTETSSEKYYKLIFYSANYTTDVWLNGHYLGYHEGGYTPFAYDISNDVNLNDDNIIAVRVDNPPQQTRYDIIPYNSISHWCHYTGIIHDIYIEESNSFHTVRADVNPIDLLGNINITYVIDNILKQNKTISANFKIYKAKINQNNIQSEFSSDLIENENNFEVMKKVKINFRENPVSASLLMVNIPDPAYWSPGSPNLYVLKITLTDNAANNILDEYYCQFGLRKLDVKDIKVYLNNKPIFFTGINRAEDHPIYGRSMPIGIIYSDLVQIHDINCNWLRTDHYPNHLYTYLITDRLGIAVTEEIPLMWFEKEGWDCQEKRNIHKQMYREMVFRDFNRPSIFMWSLCNEGLHLTKREDFIYWAKNDKDMNYPDGRLITQASNSQCSDDKLNRELGVSVNDLSQNICDVAGYTTYQGQYYNKCEEPFKYQYFSRTNSFLDEFHSIYNKPLITFEFGKYLGENLEFIDSQKTDFEEQFRAFSQHAAISADNKYNCNGFIMAVTFWNAFDFWVGNNVQWQGKYGVFDMYRSNPRPVLEDLKNAFEPYFKSGGVFNGDIPDCNKP